MSKDNWLTSYAAEAALTDRLKGRKDHAILLSAGLMGEVGSILAEMKKMQREGEAYPGYRRRLIEEIGDFLWYYVRVLSVIDPRLIDQLPLSSRSTTPGRDGLTSSLDLGCAVGSVVDLVRQSKESQLDSPLRTVWMNLVSVAENSGVALQEAADANLAKNQSRWPTERTFRSLFDENLPSEEQIPRSLTIDFVERSRGSRVEVLLRCGGIGIGDRLTDNITDQDGYRYHDIFHMANAVFLGWSPVVRALLHCKRKSLPAIDENQDGARAAVIEEAVAAIVFSRAKRMRFFEDLKDLDYDLLKSIRDFVEGFEVEEVPLWQWEKAILEGFRMFRALRAGPGGRVTWNLHRRSLDWASL
jgi:NTP pyrophosphatase (non-canonical NTP hydrolase)